MAVKVGINGFGRIGRNVFRAAFNDPDIEIVVVNDITDTATLAHLLKYDSVLGIFDADVKASDNAIIKNHSVKVLAERDRGNIPWKNFGVSIVIEATGLFWKKPDASKHIDSSGAQKVIISAPAEEPDVTLVLGVNVETYDYDNHQINSNASCTTNCLAPPEKVFNNTFGIEKAFMTINHGYTNDQRILDQAHSDFCQAQATAVSQIPSTTGAAKTVGIVIPELNGKIDGIAILIPTVNAQVGDLMVFQNKNTTVDEVNDSFREAAKGDLQGILVAEEKPLVSVDIVANPYSSISDAQFIRITDVILEKVLGWHDNKWRYSSLCC